MGVDMQEPTEQGKPTRRQLSLGGTPEQLDRLSRECANVEWSLTRMIWNALAYFWASSAWRAIKKAHGLLKGGNGG